MLAIALSLSLAAPAQVADVKAFFLQNCAVCHGQDGSAKGPDGKKLAGQDLTSPHWQKHTRDEEIVDALMKGRHAWFGPSMPSFKGRLTEAEALRLAREVIRPMNREPKK